MNPNLLFYLKLYLVTVPIFFVIDMVWLGFVARGFYQEHLGFILGDQVNWIAAIVFYLVFIVGILLFAVAPALEAKSLAKAVVLGGLFGLFTYATYDMTNLATIKNWPVDDLQRAMQASSVSHGSDSLALLCFLRSRNAIPCAYCT